MSSLRPMATTLKIFRCLYRRCPPLPIPNREVKPARADGTAVTCGRVGRCQILKGPCSKRCRASFFALFFATPLRPFRRWYCPVRTGWAGRSVPNLKRALQQTLQGLFFALFLRYRLPSGHLHHACAAHWQRNLLSRPDWTGYRAGHMPRPYQGKRDCRCDMHCN
jgi:hypothetical protein